MCEKTLGEAGERAHEPTDREQQRSRREQRRTSKPATLNKQQNRIVRLERVKKKKKNTDTHTYLTPCDTEFALPGGVSLQKKKRKEEKKKKRYSTYDQRVRTGLHTTMGELDYFLFWFPLFSVLISKETTNQAMAVVGMLATLVAVASNVPTTAKKKQKKRRVQVDQYKGTYGLLPYESSVDCLLDWAIVQVSGNQNHGALVFCPVGYSSILAGRRDTRLTP